MDETFNPVGDPTVLIPSDDPAPDDDRDGERVSLAPLDAETALKGLLAVDPKSEPASDPDE
jgi:hypothetical protein